jgi:hypothetical protein
MKTIEIEVGRLFWTQVRAFLNKCIFLDMEISFMESAGFFERDFTIRGNTQHINMVKDALDKHFEEYID